MLVENLLFILKSFYKIADPDKMLQRHPSVLNNIVTLYHLLKKKPYKFLSSLLQRLNRIYLLLYQFTSLIFIAGDVH